MSRFLASLHFLSAAINSAQLVLEISLPEGSNELSPRSCSCSHHPFWLLGNTTEISQGYCISIATTVSVCVCVCMRKRVVGTMGHVQWMQKWVPCSHSASCTNDTSACWGLLDNSCSHSETSLAWRPLTGESLVCGHTQSSLRCQCMNTSHNTCLIDNQPSRYEFPPQSMLNIVINQVEGFYQLLIEANVHSNNLI